MIMVDIDMNRSNAAFSEVKAAVGGYTTAAEVRPITTGTASDPVSEWLSSGQNAVVSDVNPRFVSPDLEWTGGHEHRFALLAEREALGIISPAEQSDLERLTKLRRSMKNQRPGEDLLREYDQRQLTRDLIKALDRYVRFHQPARQEKPAER